jgi:hypothetical protein
MRHAFKVDRIVVLQRPRPGDGGDHQTEDDFVLPNYGTNLIRTCRGVTETFIGEGGSCWKVSQPSFGPSVQNTDGTRI